MRLTTRASALYSSPVWDLMAAVFRAGSSTIVYGRWLSLSRFETDSCAASFPKRSLVLQN